MEDPDAGMDALRDRIVREDAATGAAAAGGPAGQTLEAILARVSAEVTAAASARRNGKDGKG